MIVVDLRIERAAEHCNCVIAVAGFLEDHSAALVQLILYTLPLYQDIASQRAVVATIRTAVANGTFLKTLAGSLVKLEPTRLSRQVHYAGTSKHLGSLISPSRCPLLLDQCHAKRVCIAVSGMLCPAVLDISSAHTA